jgi:predicted ribosomally synthesized peptide with nif11-like leader
MSQEALEAFRKALETNPGLLEQIRQARVAATVQVAVAAGFEITVEELGDVIQESGAELSEERLEAVAGGLLNLPFGIQGNVRR